NNSVAGTSVPSTAFFGKSLKKVYAKGISSPKVSNRNLRIVAQEIDESKETKEDRWKGLYENASDDQQDIARGKGMVDS
ncbi:hypothetical protein PN41_18525, partial [Vibrio anguillarum]|nr:hypothetical protein [Vibrio anguillarum]